MNQSDLPAPFVKMIKDLFGEEKGSEILKTFSASKPLSIRCNTLKQNPQNLKMLFKTQGFTLNDVSWSKDAFMLPGISSQSITSLPFYAGGKFYIQSLSSMIPALVLDPQLDELILDMAAAPGSKTTQMAALMKNRGEIIANDTDMNRIHKLRFILKQQGITNTKTIRMDGRGLWQKYPSYFDKVLLDAPCSMEGRFIESDPLSFTHWSPKKVKNLSRLQRWMLRSAVSATKPGGIIVYSTCTISPEENEEVVNWILEKENGKVELIDIHIPNLAMENGIIHWKNKIYSPSLSLSKRITPSHDMEGFYIAKLKKTAS